MSDRHIYTQRGDDEHLRGLREPARRAVVAQRHAQHTRAPSRWTAVATVEARRAGFTFGSGPVFNGVGNTLKNQTTGAVPFAAEMNHDQGGSAHGMA